MRALFAYLFEAFDLDQIVAGADKDNTHSIALMERLGMVFTGVANGDVEYVL